MFIITSNGCSYVQAGIYNYKLIKIEEMTKKEENTNTPLQPSLDIAGVSSSLSFEEYMKKEIEEGYISENGTPLKCWCGNKEFKQVKIYQSEYGIEEYSLQCTECLKIVGHWAYGNWHI